MGVCQRLLGSAQRHSCLSHRALPGRKAIHRSAAAHGPRLPDFLVSWSTFFYARSSRHERLHANKNENLKRRHC